MTRVAARGRRARGLPLLAAIAAAVLGCDGGAAPARAVVQVGAAAPAYAARVLSGPEIALDSLRGEVVLLNIWATWCKPCRQEIPALDTLYTRHRAEGLRVVGVSIDLEGEEGRVAAFAKELGATYELWHDPDDAVSSTFLAVGVPASYLIGRDGTLRWKHIGPVTAGDSALTAALQRALAEPRD